MRGVDAFYGRQGLAEDLVADVRARFPDGATPDLLAPVDQFHTGGVASTRALAELAGIEARDHVLDVGAGLGGPARWLAAHVGCRVTCIDLTEEYCTAARALSQLTALTQLVEVLRGDALALPFAGGAFDVVLAQNAFMNIEDKDRLFEELARVLKAGGRLVFQEVMAGSQEPLHYPVTWADSSDISFLATPTEHGAAIEEAGLTIKVWDDITAWASGLPKATPSDFGLHLLVGDVGLKAANNRLNEAEGRSVLWRALCIREPVSGASID